MIFFKRSQLAVEFPGKSDFYPVVLNCIFMKLQECLAGRLQDRELGGGVAGDQLEGGPGGASPTATAAWLWPPGWAGWCRVSSLDLAHP